MQTRDIFLQALKNASVELDDSDLGLVAELATRLAETDARTSKRHTLTSSPNDDGPLGKQAPR